MKRLCIAMILLACSSNVYAQPIKQDAQLHFLASYGLTLTTAMLFNKMKVKHPALTSAMVAFSIGLAKELTDDHVDNGDLLTNSLGIASAMIVYRVTF